jgi:hypothetical protein
MVSQESAAKTSLAQEVCELSFGTRRDVRPEDEPTSFTMPQGRFENLDRRLAKDMFALDVIILRQLAV